MVAIKGLLGNEHGLLAILLLIASAVFVALGRMSVADWQRYTEWIFGLWTGAHVGAGVASAIGASSAAAAEVPVVAEKPEA